ncbi:Peptidoglycan-binding lysin domain protein [Ascosphaera apis ARSEF 7405]|uniref:Peptidoglycan-binding lysin domain protein n=1 Tax=Ascosphaera apis ARSEF 7405 TaxID=392613 RepID=A0A167V0S4_9EURO|nr:Peptidoglycan-binding lysin domain protein [Ascosphaera apis ARSEF 7405]
MHFTIAALLGATPLASAGFSVYAPYESDPIAQALGISTDCLANLNKTIECDVVNAARAANGVRDQYWTENDINSLCTPQCSSSLNEWYSSVELACSEDTIVISDKEIEPKLIPQKYIAGYNAVCLQDSLKNWCILESQKWYQNEIPDPKNGEVLEASDVTSMFSRDQYCSECFFLMWKEKLISPSLDESRITSLDRQFQKIVEKCAADSPIVKRRNHITFEPKQDPLIMAKEPSRIEPRDATGTYLELPEGVPILAGTEAERCAKFYIIQEGDTCPSINRKFGVSMSYLMNLNQGINKYCTTLWEGYAICVTEAINPPPKPAVSEVKIAVAEEPVPVEETTTDKRQDVESVDPVTSESICACVDGEEKGAMKDVDHTLLSSWQNHASV